MSLYTERYSMREPLKKTYSINTDMYSLLLYCCLKYKKNLTHIFKKNFIDDFTGSDYVGFDEQVFSTKIKIKIPYLFRDNYDRLSVPNDYDDYDQYALLDLIEFFAQNIKDISEQWNNSYCNYKEIICFETTDIFKDFKDEINEIFTDSGLLYQLTDNKIIERIVEYSPLTKEIENSFAAVSEEGIKDLLTEAIKLYKSRQPNTQIYATEKIWDAYERLKSYYEELDKKYSADKIVKNISNGNDRFYTLFNDEFKALTKIGNDYRIRHHETNKIDITDINYYDYLFNRCLSLIALAVKYLD